jgi:DNA-binding MarR family transcriptional regulator
VQIDDAPDRLRSLPSFLLNQAAIEARRLVADALGDDGVHRSEFALLASLEQFGAQSQTTLSARSGLDRSDVVRWVDDLAERGLLERAQDPTDRRRNTITLTAQGRRRLAGLDRQIQQAQQRLLSSLSARERAQLVRLLGRVLGMN